MSPSLCTTLPQEVTNRSQELFNVIQDKERIHLSATLQGIYAAVLCLFMGNIFKSKDAATYQNNTVIQNEYIHQDTCYNYNFPHHHQGEPFLPVAKQQYRHTRPTQTETGTNRREASPCQSESGIALACPSSNPTGIPSNQGIHDHCNLCECDLLLVVDWNHSMLQMWNRICEESDTGDRKSETQR